MKIIQNLNGNITIDVEDYNQEEIAFIIKETLRRHNISNVELLIEEQKSICWNCKHLHKSISSKSNGDKLLYNCWCTVKEEIGITECDQFLDVNSKEYNDALSRILQIENEQQEKMNKLINEIEDTESTSKQLNKSVSLIAQQMVLKAIQDCKNAFI